MNCAARRITFGCARRTDRRVSRFYFAYGSNMNPARVSGRGLRFDLVCGARLDGVRVSFDKQSRDHPLSGHANLAYERGACAEGVLYRLESAAEIERMDAFEATPVNYSREIVSVMVNADPVVAWTYFANPAVVRSGLRPERAYLKHLLAGREHLSPRYFQWLKAVRCVDD